MTLVETLIATGLLGLVSTALVLTMAYSGRSFAALTNYSGMDGYGRLALDTMSTDIRQAQGCATNTALSASRLSLVGTNVETLARYTITYTYSTNSQTLTRNYSDVNGTNITVLLTNCTSLQFSYYQRNPTSGAYDNYPVDDLSHPELCKLVQITWVCVRTMLGNRSNTESVQSAKVVIRKG